MRKAIRRHSVSRIARHSHERFELLFLLEEARQLAGAARAKPQRAVAAALAHLEANYPEPLQMAALVYAAGCGRVRLFQLFKQSTGMTPDDHLQRPRVNKAHALLAGTTRSVTDIAYATGFSSSQYFSKVFRKYDGTTPTVARERQAKSRTPQR